MQSLNDIGLPLRAFEAPQEGESLPSAEPPRVEIPVFANRLNLNAGNKLKMSQNEAPNQQKGKQTKSIKQINDSQLLLPIVRQQFAAAQMIESLIVKNREAHASKGEKFEAITANFE